MTTPVFTAKAPKVKIDNSQMMAVTGAKIVHINSGSTYYRKMTIAYREINKSLIEIAVAITHKADQFEKKKGTQVALDNFADGETIIIPRDRHMDAAAQLQLMFERITA